MSKKLYTRHCKFCAEYNQATNTEKRQIAYEPFWSITAEIEQYNKKHGTSLSYGKYVCMMKFINDKKKKKEVKK